ncbi:MAG: hypothetical protein AB7P03_30675 [Kofleriaceae bacterium]
MGRTGARDRAGSSRIATSSASDLAELQIDARRALIKLGFKSREASTAVSAAMAHVGHEPTLEQLLREALRRCSNRSG